MSSFATAINNLLAKTPLSATFGSKVALPDPEDKSLLAENSHGESEKCEVRIEGMTCGACVEVSSPVVMLAADYVIEQLLRLLLVN